MSETVLKIMLSELTTVRIHCQGLDGQGSCPGIVEMALAKMVEKYQSQKCPLCGASIPNTSPNHLEQLGRSIEALNGQRGLKIEFVIPQKDK